MPNYNDRFYQWQSPGSLKSAQAMVPLVMELVQPKSVVDVGCGIGTWLSVFKAHGVQDCLGLDGEYVNQRLLQIKHHEFVSTNLQETFGADRQFDLAMSLEVAEHLPKDRSTHFVECLTGLSTVVFFSAAVPHQGGEGHVNEQWPDYWYRLFQDQGYQLIDVLRLPHWDQVDIESWYIQNSMIFATPSSAKMIQQRAATLGLHNLAYNGQIFSLVHPRLYQAFVQGANHHYGLLLQAQLDQYCRYKAHYLNHLQGQRTANSWVGSQDRLQSWLKLVQVKSHLGLCDLNYVIYLAPCLDEEGAISSLQKLYAQLWELDRFAAQGNKTVSAILCSETWNQDDLNMLLATALLELEDEELYNSTLNLSVLDQLALGDLWPILAPHVDLVLMLGYSSHQLDSDMNFQDHQAVGKLLFNLPHLTEPESVNLIQDTLKTLVDYVADQESFAVNFFKRKCYPEAQEYYGRVVRYAPQNPKNWTNLAISYLEGGQPQLALQLLEVSIALDHQQYSSHTVLGRALEALGHLEEAGLSYQLAIQLEPTQPDAYGQLSNLLGRSGQTEAAVAVCQQAVAAIPEHFGAYLNLANFLVTQQQWDQAIKTYEKVLELSPAHPDALANLGEVHRLQGNESLFHRYSAESYFLSGDYGAALEHYDYLLAEPDYPAKILQQAVFTYSKAGEHDRAIELCQQGITQFPEESFFVYSLIHYISINKPEDDTLDSWLSGVDLHPDILAFEKARAFPIVYQSVEKIQFYRDRYCQALNQLVQIDFSDQKTQKQLWNVFSSSTNFYLAYHCKNDLALQRQYASCCHQFLSQVYPHWTQSQFEVKEPKARIRVGYVSQFIRSHNGAWWALNWIRHHNRDRIEVYTYSLDDQFDEVTEEFQNQSTVFRRLHGTIVEAITTLQQDQLDVLIFTDIGMGEKSFPLSCLRLAPVQCTAWGHPVTSGSPTLDYYLSGDLMEPENAQEHYSETLIRLPNLGLCYPKPFLPKLTKTRQDFGLQIDRTFYFSCQSLFKYLPQYDFIYPAIAQADPTAYFVFLESYDLAETFLNRLDRAFRGAGLTTTDWCTVLPRQSRTDYLLLMQLADIYLDTLGWSGGNTTMDAVACGLPIVTWPGELMRGRHSYGILKMLGIEETIAMDPQHYIEIAADLGRNPHQRRALSRRMCQSHPRLYNDTTTVAALDRFLIQAVEQIRAK